MILMKFDGKYATINGIAVLNGNTGTIDICSSSRLLKYCTIINLLLLLLL